MFTEIDNRLLNGFPGEIYVRNFNSAKAEGVNLADCCELAFGT